MTAAVSFGSLDDALRRAAEGRNLFGSAGPVSDAFIVSTAPVSLLEGPIGSGKTVASVKRALVEAIRLPPEADGVRRYWLGVFREKYENIWGATLPSWFEVLPRDLPGATFTGSRGRPATHLIAFEDRWGKVVLQADFLAFGEDADPEDLRGKQYSDAYLNEMDTMPENLLTNITGRIGRKPPRAVMLRDGRIFGDSNAPDVLNWTYRDFFETPKPGYVLYRQPGGLDPNAENPAMGRAYYEQIIKLNAHRKWYVRRMVHNQPGFTRDSDMVYPAYDDERNLSPIALEPVRQLKIIVGIDGGLTPAAAYCQEMPNGQLRVLAEVALERGGMAELARAMLAVEAALFPDFMGEDYVTDCDPAMTAGEDTELGSDRHRLAKLLGRKVSAARTNETGARWDAVRAKISLQLEDGQPGLWLDPSCKGLRRGFNQTYHLRKVQGTNDLGSVVKTFDSHVHDALQYAALRCGTALARMNAERQRLDKERRREEGRNAGRYNPLRRRG